MKRSGELKKKGGEVGDCEEEIGVGVVYWNERSDVRDWMVVDRGI